MKTKRVVLEAEDPVTCSSVNRVLFMDWPSYPKPNPSENSHTLWIRKRGARQVTDGSATEVVFAVSKPPQGHNPSIYRYDPVSKWVKEGDNMQLLISASTNSAGQAVVFANTSAGDFYEWRPAGWQFVSGTNSVVHFSSALLENVFVAGSDFGINEWTPTAGWAGLL